MIIKKSSFPSFATLNRNSFWELFFAFKWPTFLAKSGSYSKSRDLLLYHVFLFKTTYGCESKSPNDKAICKTATKLRQSQVWAFRFLCCMENKKFVALRSKTSFHTHKGSSKTEKKKEKAGQNNKRVVLQDIRLMMIEFPDFHHAWIIF